MKLFTAILCLAISTYGVPQGRRFGGFGVVSDPFNSVRNVSPQPLTSFLAGSRTETSENGLFPLKATGPIVINVPNQGPSIHTEFGAFPLGTEHFMTREQRNQYVPVMRALLTVMESSNPSPNDINALLVLTRDLAAQIPEGGDISSLGFGADLGADFGGLDINAIKNIGLVETGNVIAIVNNVPHIMTQFGAFPLSETSLMTDEERAKFLPVVRTFISVLEKDTLNPQEINLLLEQSRDLTNDAELSGGLGGLGGGLFGGLIEGLIGGLSGGFAGGLSGLGVSSQSSQSAVISGRRPAPTPFIPGRQTAFTPAGSSDSKLFPLPASGPLIENVPNQGPSFNTEFGKIPLDSQNLISPEERARLLPVMRALLTVMVSPTPAPEDVNTLLVLSRDLSKFVPEGSNQFGGFANLEGIAAMGLPETGDVVKFIDGEPHIETQFGSFPLSAVSLLTNEERQRFLPATRTFINVLEKDTVDPSELNTLLEQSRELTNLIPDNLLSQFGSGLGGLGR